MRAICYGVAILAGWFESQWIAIAIFAAIVLYRAATSEGLRGPGSRAAERRTDLGTAAR